MSKFRIVRLETTDGSGKTTNYYKIQKKTLFWFFDHWTTTCGYTNEDYNKEPYQAAFLDKHILLHDTEVRAREFLQKTENPFSETYKGNFIERVFDDRDWSDIYINRSFYRDVKILTNGFKRAYEFANTIDELRNKIDKRIVKTKVFVV